MESSQYFDNISCLLEETSALLAGLGLEIDAEIEREDSLESFDPRPSYQSTLSNPDSPQSLFFPAHEYFRIDAELEPQSSNLGPPAAATVTHTASDISTCNTYHITGEEFQSPPDKLQKLRRPKQHPSPICIPEPEDQPTLPSPPRIEAMAQPMHVQLAAFPTAHIHTCGTSH